MSRSVVVTRVRALLLLLVFCVAAPAGAQTFSVAGPGGPVDLGTWSIGDVQIPLTGTGGSGPYSFSLVGGSLPAGMSLRTDLPPWFSPAASAGLIGVPTTTGVFTVTLRVSDAASSADYDTTFKISPLTAMDYWTLPDAFLGHAYSYTFTALNNAGLVTWSMAGWAPPLPPGVSLSSTGTLSGTPAAAGFYNITVAIHDAGTGDTVYRTFNLGVYAIDITTDGLLPYATIDVPYTATIASSGGTGPITYTASTLPQGFTLDAATGTISGTPINGSGRFSFFLTATDSAHVSYSKTMSLVFVSSPPLLPSVTPYGNGLADCTFAWPCSRGVGGFSGGVPPFTWSATGLPPGMGIRWGSSVTSRYIAPGDAEIWGVATAAGLYDVQVTVSDATGASATNVFPFHISELEQTNFLASGTLNQPYSQTLRVIGGTGSYTIEQTGGRLPLGLSFDAATFTVSGTPTENGSFNAEFTFTDTGGHTLRVNNGLFIGGDTSGSSTLQITSGNDLGTAHLGSFYSRQFSACCLPAYDWSLVGGTPPSGLTLSASGVLSGTPTTIGTFQFTVRVADPINPSNTAARQMTLIVTPMSVSATPAPPIFGNVGTLFTMTLAANGNTGAVTWTRVPGTYLPPGLTLSGNTISGTPAFSGQFNFQVTATDSLGQFAKGFFTISIYPAGVNPPLSLTTGSSFGPLLVGQVTINLTASGGSGGYHYSLSPGATIVPGMRVQDGQPLPTFFGPSITGAYLGVIETAGVYRTSIRVTDSSGAFFDRAIALTVTPLNIVSQFQAPRASVGSPYDFTLQPYGGSGAYSWSASNLPPGLAIAAATGHVSGTPTTTGTFFSTVTLTDLVSSASLTTTVMLVVNPFSIETNGVLPAGNVGVAYSQTLTAPGCGSGCSWSGGLPFPLTLATVGGNGVISGTPTSTFNSFFTVQANGGANGTVLKVFALAIATSPAQPLSISNGAQFGATTVGNGTTLALFAQGGTAPYTWTLDSGALPLGMSIAGPGETLGATLAPGFTYLIGKPLQAGTYTFTLRVTDFSSASTTRTFTWPVSALSFQYNSLPLAGSTLVLDTAYAQPLLVTGGTSNYTWTTPAMPPGLTLDSTTGVVSGTPANTGTFSVPVTVTDDAGHAITSNLNLTIGSGTPAFVAFGLAPTLGPIQQGASTTFSLSPSGGTAPYTITALTSLPPGFALETGNAVLSNGTPGSSYFLAGAPLTGGTFTFTLRAQDSTPPASGGPNIGLRTFTLTVASLAVFTSSIPDGLVNAPYSAQLVAVSPNGPVTWGVVPGAVLPVGLSVSPAGAIAGTPTVAGTFTLQLTASDGLSAPVSLFFSLRILLIAIAGPGILPMATALEPYSYTFTATGGGPSVVWTAFGLPAGLSISTGGTISGSPIGGGGTSQITVTATDGPSVATRRFSLFVRTHNVILPSYAMVATALPDAVVGQTYIFTLNPGGGLPPYTWTVAAGSSLPPGLSLLTGAQLPPTIFPGFTVIGGAASAAGLYTFDLILADSLGTQLRRTFTLNVADVTVLAGNPRVATVNVPYAEQFTAVGGTPPYVFSLTPPLNAPTQDTLPPGFSLSASGLLSGTTSSSGTYLFVLRVQDAASHSFSRSYQLIVSTASGLRVTSQNPPNGWVGGGLARFLTTNGLSTYTWSLVGGALPPGVVLVPDVTDPTRTLLSGQPTTDGLYSYTLRATDTANAAESADHAFTFRVSPMQIETPAFSLFAISNLPSAQLGAPYSTTIRVAGGTPLYSFVESSAAPLPPGLTLGADGTLSGTPSAIGSFTVAVVVTDSSGRTFYAPSLPLFISPAGTVPGLTAPAFVTLGHASAGRPYRFPLNIARGGAEPFSWTVASPSTLPPGMLLFAGSNGVPDHLGGVPTTPGAYDFALNVTDGSGQSLTVPLSLTVSPLALTPGSLAPGIAGTPYSASLVPSGGTGPYTIQALPNWDLPPGLTVSSSGVLSGTPTNAGNFLIGVQVTDSAPVPNTLFTIDAITIDNAAAEAPAVTLAPRSIQIVYTQTYPDPGPVPASVASTSSAIPFDIAIEGIPGATLSSPGGSTPTSIGVDLHLPSLGAGTYRGILATRATGSANVLDGIPVTVAVIPAPPCAYTLIPSSGSVPASGGSGSFDLDTAGSCAWSATASDPSWITITSASNGTGATTIGYSVTPNAGAAQRAGTITVNGQVHTITQFGTSCSFAINPVSLSAPASASTATIALTASDASCSWTASGLAASPASGTGSDTVTVTIPPNNAPASQTLTATIAGQTFTVNQAGVNCTVTLDPSSASFGDAGGSGVVAISTPAGCGYATTAAPSWVTLDSGSAGSGSGTLIYTVQANSATTARSGTLTIGGQTFAISQSGAACSITLDTAGLGSPFDPAGGTGTIGITTNGASCTWTTSSAAPWVTVAPPGSSGNGSVLVTVGSNAASISPRSTTVTIGGQTVTIAQGGTTCSFALQSSTGTVPSSGGTGTAGIVAPSACAWTASSNNLDWLTISTSGGSGTSDVPFVAQPNPDATPRTGTIALGGHTYTVTQPAASCSFTLPIAGIAVSSDGVSGTAFSLSTSMPSCTPAPVSYASWIAIDGTSFAGGSGSVIYSVAANPLGATRRGTVQVGDRTFTVTQLGAPCGYSLSQYGAAFGRAGGTSDLLGSPSAIGCSPAFGTDQPAFVTVGALSGPTLNIFTLPFTVSPFETSLTVAIRRARITFGGQIFIVKQVSW